MKTRKRPLKENSYSNLGKAKKQKVKNDRQSPTVKLDKCNVCKQYIQDIKFYTGHHNKSCEEFIALTDERLSLFTGEEEHIPEGDELPQHKITHFSVYDEKGHLCPFDTGLVEKNVFLNVSGYIKPIYDEDFSPNNGVPAHDIGPINEWYISGFDGGEMALVGISTGYASYILMEPSEEYAPFVKLLRQKIALVKLVIEFLIDRCTEDPTYEDLLTQIESSGNGELTEDLLLQHAQFICDQIYSYDQAEGEDGSLCLITTPCVRTLVNLAGVTFRRRKKIRQSEMGYSKKTTFTKATTTPLVRSIFENFFPDQIEIKDKKGPKKRRCGVCDACQAPDCGKCINCKDMVKFGGTGRGKQACKSRRCPNMAVEDAELSENEEEVDDEKEPVEKKKVAARVSVNKVQWCDKPIFESKGRQFYSSAIVGEIDIRVGDHVMLNPENPNEPLCIGKVVYMYDKFPQGPTIHAHLFYRGSDTILGETADPQELFAVNVCEDCPLGSIVRKAEVIFKETPKDWFNLGGTATLPQPEDDGHSFHFSKQYHISTGSFTDYVEIKHKDSIDSCSYCWLENEKKKSETPVLEEDVVTYRQQSFRVGSSVFLNPSVYNFSSYSHKSGSDSVKSVDDSVYTEYYRKTGDVKGSNQDTPEPFCIGQIEKMWEKGGDIKIKVRIFFRAENTKSGPFLSYQTDINLVYWTEEVTTVSFKEVRGKCYLMYCDVIDSSDWCDEGPYRFYFKEAYNPKTYEFEEVPDFAKKIGYVGKGKGKGKSKSSKASLEQAPVWEKIDRPLRCMDIFAGCGGLSKGLHQAGVAETKWAIEKEIAAAQAFKLNNKDCHVFTDDCNNILQQVMSGEGELKGLPAKGEVEMLVGGPPCQGFSGMNRFNAGQYSLFKNSLVVTFLSLCDFYRPKIFVLENVRNFVTFKRSMVLKLALRCLLAIGYQVTFGVLQAGHYGVPQTRRRVVLLAAAPGYILPKLPEPQHVFNKRGCYLSFALDGVRYTNGNLWTESAPYRTMCVRDAISDLPDIKNGWNKPEIPYDEDPISHFQRKMRGDDKVLVDHICKEMAPIVEARIGYIPVAPGSDWRDLPNIAVKLSDGTMTAKLRYPYLTARQKEGEPNRGVCQCSVGLPCEPADRQVNTVIPWCLPHTGDRHNHWSGLYGRLEWDGFFGTTITNPEPMGKQGRVLHPEQNRVVSVRECARSQGFPDHFKFYGTIMDKHRQVGNAVPPPLGKAVGLEIKKALATLGTQA